ncbi:MAG: hypothetical protein AB7K41_13575, partial [Bdellovibrionales bacterium]
GEIGPAALITKRHPAVGFLDRESLLSQSRIKDYFVRPPSQVIVVEQVLKSEHVDQALKGHEEWGAVALLTSNPQFKTELDQLALQRTSLSQCGAVESASSWVDALLYRMNPKHNQRRRPTWYVVCERSA